MRERKLGLRLGAIALGAGLAVGVAATASAQDFSDPDAFIADFGPCIETYGISECVEEVEENLGLEEEEVLPAVDLTPYNPIDEGSIVVEDDVVFLFVIVVEE